MDYANASVVRGVTSSLPDPAGIYEFSTTINGHTVKITGTMVNGEWRYGSMWIPIP